MERTARHILKFRWSIIIVVLIITAILGLQLKNIRINSDVISSLPDEDPDAALLKEVATELGGNNMGMIILTAEDIFTPVVLEHIRQISDTVAEIEGIRSVTSLTNIIDIKSGEFGIEVGKLIDEYNMPETPAELAELKERVYSKEMYRGNIISEDGTATLILFTLSEDAQIRAVAERVKEKTEALNLPENIYFAGSPMMVTSISELIATDLVKLIPISFVLISLILFLSFRTFRGVALPVLTAAIAIVWTMGIMALAGYEMSMISNNIPIILLAVGSAYTIHVINRINQERARSTKDVIIKALVYIFIPVLLAALTTMTGFMSFIFGAYLDMIREFGVLTSAGTLFSAILSLIFVPAVISILPPGQKAIEKQKLRNKKSFLSANVLVPLKIFLYVHPKYTLFTWFALILISVGGIFMITRSVNIQDYFRRGNPTRIAEDIMVNKFGGSKPVFVIFEGDLQHPKVLQKMRETQEYMEKNPGISTTQSVADLILEMNTVLGGEAKIPDEKAKIGQLWFLLDGQEYMERFVSPDLDKGIILSKFSLPDNQSKKAFAEYMRRFIAENSTESCKIQITGMPFVDVTMDRSLIRSQFGSLSIAVFFVVLLVGLIMGSLLKGIYATLPIISSIVILFGFMGYTGIPLNIATVLVASVALGIGIDYSIHIMSHFNHIYKKGGDVYRSLRDTLMISGKAIIINVLSVSAGFLVLLFSEMVPLKYFGLLIAISMIFSGLGSLTLLPVILVLVNRKQKFTRTK
ncbi:MAG: efflux RND transporter permease subunit [Bacteroidales bacterium]